MIYIILIVLGLVGISTTLWISHPKWSHTHTPSGDAWYILHPENFESGVIQYARSLLRAWIKWLLIWMIHWYRRLSEKVTVKQVLKKKIRGFLYEHTHDSIRHPSEFWNKVRKSEKKPRPLQDHAPTEKPVEIDDAL